MADDKLGSKAVIDWKHCVELTDNDAKLAKDVLLMLGKQLEQDQPRLKTAIKTNDLDTLREINHSILGAASYTGVPQLHAASLAFSEYLKESDDLTNVKHQVEQIIVTIDNLLAAIKQLPSQAQE